MSSFNPPEPYVWTCLNHWVIPDMISTPVSPLFRHLVKMIILSFPRETFDLDFCLLTLEAKNIYRNNVTPWPGGRFAHRGKNPWSLIEGGGTIVELWHVTRWILHCKTAVVTQSMVYLCCPGKLWTWRCWTFAIFATRRTARMAGLPCNGNVEQRSPANSTTGWGTTDHTPSEMDCTAMLCISEPKTHHASELRK